MADIARLQQLCAAWLALGALSSCEAYDSTLLVSAESALELELCGNGVLESSEFCDTAIATGMDGACPTECKTTDACAPQVLAGTGCKRRCMSVRITSARNRDGCCPDQVSPGEDDDCGTCGDGIVGPSETCDPPSDCTSEALCHSEDPCIEAVFIGKAEACTARCELKPVSTCGNGDGCCPARCVAEADNDCSASCNDGVLDANETCEPDSSTAPCPESCDDEDPCTRDTLVGSASNCSAHCIHAAITEPADGDGCCPRGAQARVDGDCQPVCGNEVTEPGEECDWGELCSANCRRMFHPSLAHRYRFSGAAAVATDSVGGADGAIVNTELNGDDALHLSGGSSGQYVNLPNGLISGLTSATIEVWLAWTGASATHWQRIFDFGNNRGGENQRAGAATSFWFLTTSNNDGGVGSYLNFTAAAGDVLNDRNASTSGLLRDGQLHHVAVVFDGERRSLQLYVDGRLEQNITGLSGGLLDIDDRNAWIGRSNWGDADLEAVIYEFRIYRSALSAADVSLSYQNGSDPATDRPLAEHRTP